ncbi:MAG TPA: hypothetical protein VGM17_02385 [Rhizomicrobium sp.]|jgi:DNA-binding MarR family transcriptional regulator
MTGKYLGLALHYGGEITPEERLILIVLGDNADDEGLCRRAPFEFMARMIGKSVPELRAIIDGMEKRDLVNRTGSQSIEVLISDADPYL